jgi:cobalt/nickel transport system permease protein
LHIPDGWLSLPVILLTWSIVLISLGISFSKFKDDDITKISNIGAISSVIFVAQMFNFPVIGGTSGHLLGAALATYVVGFPGAVISLFVVLLVQALVFADGGILALGANTLNMGIIGGLIAFGVKKTFESYHDKNSGVFIVSAFIAAFLSVILASFFAGIELVVSNKASFHSAIPLILFYHVLIGVGEGLLTAFIIYFLIQSEFPFEDYNVSQFTNNSFVDSIRSSNKPLLGLGIIILIFSVLSLFASEFPDGLERVGKEKLFGDGISFSLGLFDDYTFFGSTDFVGTLLSAFLGIIIITGVLIIPIYFVKEQKQRSIEGSSILN